MQSVETSFIREIARELYTGRDFDNYFKTGNLAKYNFPKKVSEKLKEKLGNTHGDRIYTGRTLNKSLLQKLRGVLSGKSELSAIDVEYSIKSNKRPRNDPIIDYDSDVSSEDGTSGDRTLDSSALMESSILDMSTRSSSGRIEQLEAKVFALEAANKALEARAKAAEDECRLWQDKSRGLFKVRYRPTRANGSGRCEVFDPRLEAIVLDAENRGVAAKHVYDVCRAFVDILGWFDEGDSSYRKMSINIRTVQVQYLEKFQFWIRTVQVQYLEKFSILDKDCSSPILRKIFNFG